MRKLRLADAPCSDLLPHPLQAAVEAKVLRHSEEHAGCLRGGGHLFGLGGVHRQRLLAQDRLPMLQRQQSVVAVHRIRRSDEDDVDVRRGAQLLARGEAVGDLVLGAVLARLPPDRVRHIPVSVAYFALREGGISRRTAWWPKPRIAKRTGDCVMTYSRTYQVLVGVVLEDLFGEEVLDLRLIVQHLEIGVLQQLRPAIAQLLPDRLLHARIIQVALPGGSREISL